MPGPQFLLLFAVFAVVVFMAVRAAIARAEAALPSDGRVRDPYEIACLRGGRIELVRVVALNLNLRGLLQLKDNQLRPAAGADAQSLVPIERAVLQQSRTVARPALIADGSAIKAAAAVYEENLVRRGLLADAGVRRLRGVPVLIGSTVLVALAASKIYVALSTGHRNVGFLMVLTGVAVLVLFFRLWRRRTCAGDAALADLTQLFNGLRQRRRSFTVGAESDATLLAAVYGGVDGSGVDPAAWRRLFARPDGSSGGSSCGSSCGGGGGCGGGGCGGCGS